MPVQTPEQQFQALVAGDRRQFQFDFRSQNEFFRSAGKVGDFDVAFSATGAQEFFKDGEILTGAARQQAQKAAGGVKGLNERGFTNQFSSSERAIGAALTTKLGFESGEITGDAARAQIGRIGGSFIRENKSAAGQFSQFSSALTIPGTPTSGEGFEASREVNLGGGTKEVQFKGGGAARTQPDGSFQITQPSAATAAFEQANTAGGTSNVPTLQDAIGSQNQLPGAFAARNPLIAKVQQAQTESQRNQQQALGQAPAGREAILNASPQLRQASDALLSQAQDPGGGGFREDFQERIRVQQAAAGLSGGNQAAFQEAALTAGALGQRRTQAAGQLQNLGGSFLQQLGIGAPIVADLAGIGQTELASQTFSAVQAANQAQSEISQQLFQQISGFLSNNRTLPPGSGPGVQETFDSTRTRNRTIVPTIVGQGIPTKIATGI